MAAPVMVVTLCRYEHFVNCIESLQRNSYAVQTELYIGIDCPFKEAHMEGYNKICEYVDKGIEGFKKVHVIKQSVNLGTSKHFLYLLDVIFQDHDCYIYSEDDNVFSPNYLEYMNKCLEFYEDDEKVLGVSGYLYPNCLPGFKGNVTRISTYFSAFGYGYYKRSEELLAQHLNMDYFIEMFKNVKKMRQLRKDSPNQFCNFVKGMIEYIPDLIRDDKIRTTDLAYGLYTYFADKVVIFPAISKVRNNGYDGSGVNCGVQENAESQVGNTYRDYDFSKQPIDRESSFNTICEEAAVDINKELSQFFITTKREEIFSVFVYYMTLLLGRKYVVNIIKKLKRI